MKTYLIIDSQTETVVGRYKSLRSAERKVDKLEKEYGGCRYSVRVQCE